MAEANKQPWNPRCSPLTFHLLQFITQHPTPTPIFTSLIRKCVSVTFLAIIMPKRLRDWVKRKVKPSTSLAPYTYTPLQRADSIRLIELLPGGNDSPVRCNIVQIRRNSPTRDYEALSYAWGEPKFTQRLEEAATNTVISITESLHEALQALRNPDTNRWLWVDAVCIAQGDVEEKNHQVRQMADIYREAESVIVWVGNDDFLDIFEKLSDVARACQKAIQSGYASDARDCITNEEVNTALRQCNWEKLAAFFDLPWFNRVWTVQEFVLAKKGSIHAGRASMDFPVFGYAVTVCYKYVRQSEDSRYSPEIFRIRKLVRFREIHMYDKSPSLVRSNKQNHDPQEPSRLWFCLSMLNKRQCTNEPDKFYSMLGLLPDSSGISPNYESTIFDVRTDVTKKLLLAGNLWTLDCAETFMDTAIQDSAPSFLIRVPYSKQQSISEIFNPLPVHVYDYGSMLKTPFKFCGHTAEDTGPSTIGLQGVAIDRVVELVFCKEINGVYKLSSDKSLLGDFHFVPNLSNLRDIYGYISKAHLSQDELAHFECSEIERCFWRTITYGSTSIKYADDDSIDTLLQNFEIGSDINFQRVFFVTELGFFGLCSRWTRVGDQMVCFQGAQKPHILRPVVTENGEKRWKLIGDCYVDNGMVGHCIAFDCDDNSGERVEEKSPEPQDGHNGMRRKRVFAEQFVLC
jgi:hypothetical protein